MQETRDNPDAVADHGVEEVAAHCAKFIDGLDSPPILIGHSSAACSSRSCWARATARPGSPSTPLRSRACCRFPLSALYATLPVFKNPANRHRAVSLTADQFAYGFGNALSRKESDRL